MKPVWILLSQESEVVVSQELEFFPGAFRFDCCESFYSSEVLVFFWKKLMTPDSDEYVFWFIVVGAYLLIFNFFWLIRHLAEKTFFERGEVGGFSQSVSNVGVYCEIGPKKWHQKKNTDLEGRAFLYFVVVVLEFGVGRLWLSLGFGSPHASVNNCNGKMRIFAEVLSGGTSLRCGRSISCEELWERMVYPPHRYLGKDHGFLRS